MSKLTPSRRPGVPHHRARFTARGRWDVVRRVVEDRRDVRPGGRLGERVEVDGVGVGAPLAGRVAGQERASLACLEERSSRPHRSPAGCRPTRRARICELRERTGWSPRRLADEPEIGRPHSTVHRVLQRGGCSRRPRPERPAVVRYEWPCPASCCTWTPRSSASSSAPGHAVTGDRTRRSRRVGWEYVHSIVDDCSPAGLLGDPRRRDGRRPSPRSPAARWTASSTTGSSPSG